MTYDVDMVEAAREVELPTEEFDVTGNEWHNRLLSRLHTAIAYALADTALVAQDIFLRVEGRQQAAADILVTPGLKAGRRTVYRIPAEPVPAVTLEVLSPANRTGTGLARLAGKRDLFGRIGVPLHIEVDPDEAFISVWESRDGRLVRTGIHTSYSSDAIGGVRIETPEVGVTLVFDPSGREVPDADTILARASHLAARLRDMGVDPDEVDDGADPPA